jgi:hypothetical protein
MSDAVVTQLWILTPICIAGCIYARRRVLSGVICGVIAPIVVFPLWLSVALAVNVPYLLVKKLVPGMFVSLEKSSSATAGAVLYFTNPGVIAVFITAGLFIWYCIVERRNSHVPTAYAPSRGRRMGSSPFMRCFWR